MGSGFAYMIPDPGRLGQHSDQVTAVAVRFAAQKKFPFHFAKPKPAELPIISPGQWVRKVKLTLPTTRRRVGGEGGAELGLYSFLTSGLKGEVSITLRLLYRCEELENALNVRLGGLQSGSTPVFLNRRAAALYQALASIMPGRERFSWNLSF